MALTKFEMVLDSPIYYAGQVIKGMVIVELKKPMKINGIYFFCGGQGRVQWTWDKTTYIGTEQYVELSELICGNPNETTEVPVGEHVFSFQLLLPIDLPCSYKDLTGSVTYGVRTEIRRPWKSNLVKEGIVTVMSIYDLNRQTLSLTLPIKLNRAKTFLGHSGELFMSVDIPVSGFVCGQIIPIRISIDNKSKVRVGSIIVVFSQLVAHRVHSRVNSRRFNVAKKKIRLENGFGSENKILNFPVPPLPPSNMEELSRVIAIRYYLTIEAKVGTFRSDLSIETEVQVGNIPLFNYQKPISREQQSALTDSDTVIEFPHLMSYGNFAPPIFEEQEVTQRCMIKRADMMYPVYTFETMPSCSLIER